MEREQVMTRAGMEFLLFEEFLVFNPDTIII
jgi:hypothetical protein